MRRLGLIAFAALLISAYWLEATAMPFIWIGLTWGAAFFVGMFCLRGTWPKAVLFNCGVVAIALTAAEAYLAAPRADPPEYSDGYAVADDVLGSRPAKGITGRSRRTDRGKLLYDVTYTIGSNGLRIAPPTKQDNAPCIAFFGCSFTFGEGLNDTETLPYQVGSQSGGAYRTFNFGFHGYGPQQMLSGIEQGHVNQIADCHPKIAIYQAITNHVRRVAGKVSFGRHGPRYVLDSGGAVHLGGHIDDADKPRSPLTMKIRGYLSRSAICQLLRNRVSSDDIRLMLATVGKSRDLLTAHHPGIKFYVILWKPGGRQDREVYRDLQEGFRELHIPVHRVEDILPAFNVDPAKYVLGASDRHPNAAANRILAHYVLARLVEQP